MEIYTQTLIDIEKNGSFKGMTLGSSIHMTEEYQEVCYSN